MALGVVIEVPSYLMCAFGMDSLGRRMLLVATQLTCALFALGSLLIPEGVGSWAMVACSTLAKFATTAAFTIVILQVLNWAQDFSHVPILLLPPRSLSSFPLRCATRQWASAP